MLIEQVFEKLQNEKLCNSAYDFSVRYLGKSKSYYSVIKARKKMPGIATIATLEMALKNTAFLFSNSSHPVINKTHQSLYELYPDRFDVISRQIISRCLCPNYSLSTDIIK